MTYIKLNKIYGHRRNVDFLNPKVGLKSDFIFPKMSMLLWLDYTYEYTPSRGDLVHNVSRPNIFIVDRLINVSKTAKRNGIKVNQLTSELKSSSKDLKVITTRKSLMLSPSSMLIANVSLINELYRYKNTPTLIYDQFADKLNTAIETINDRTLGIGRHNYLTVELPNSIPSYVEMNKLIKYSPKKLLNETNDKRTLLFIELYKWFDEDLSKSSIFNRISTDMWVNTSILFTSNNKFLMVNLNDLKAIVKNKEIKSDVSGFSETQAKKLILLLGLYTIVSDGVKIDDLGKHETKLSNFKEVTLDNIDDMLEEVGGQQEVETLVVEDQDTMDDVVVPTLKELQTVNKSIQVKTSDALLDMLNRGVLSDKQYKKQLEHLAKQDKILKDLEPTADEKELLDDVYRLEDIKTVEDKSLLFNKIGAMRKTYIAKSHEKNILRAIYGIQSSGHIVTNIEKTDTVDNLGDYTDYKISISTADKNPVTLSLRIPKLEEDGTFKISGNTYITRPQIGEQPIKKISPTEVILSSYYGKLPVSRDKYSKNNLSVKINKLLDKNENVENLISGDSFMNMKGLPYLYTNISKTVKSFTLNDLYFLFAYESRHILLKRDDDMVAIEKDGLLIGKQGSGYLLLKDETVYLKTPKGVSELGKLLELMGLTLKDIPPQVSTLSIFSKVYPLILILLHKYTFSQLLKLTNATHKKVPYARGIRLADDEFKVVFVDYVYIFKRDNRENEMLFGGLTNVSELKDMHLKHFDNIHGLGNVGAVMGMDRSIMTEIGNIHNMFLDSMTIEALKYMKEPTDIVGLLLRANELLLQEYTPDVTDIDFMRIKGDERVAGIIHNELSKSIRSYEGKKRTSRAKITMNPYQVWSVINSDSATVLVEDMNPIGLLKQTADITFSGAVGGRGKDSMVRSTRAYHKSSVGVISEGVKDSTDVGITMYLSVNPKLDGTTGMKIQDDDTLTDANIFSTSILLAPDSTKDDAKRMMFIGIQNGHVTPMLNQSVLPVRTPYQGVLADVLPDKYSVTASDDGVVIGIKEHSITVKYKEGKKEYSLGSWFSKDDGGISYQHKSVTTLAKGSKFKRGHTLTYDRAFFGPDMFNPSKVVLKTGIIVRTQFLEDSDTYEDSIGLDKSMSVRLSTPTTKVRSITIDSSFKVSKIKRIGDIVDSLDSLLIMTDVNNDEQEEIGEQLNLEEDSLSILSELNDSSPKAKSSGEIVNIECYYNGNISDMTNSLSKFVKECDIRLKEKTLKDVTGKVSSGYSIKGKPLTPGNIEIKFYIEKLAIASVGDKYVFGNQLKGTVSTLTDNTITESGRLLEGSFSTKSESARIVNSADLTGVKTTILRESSLRIGMM